MYKMIINHSCCAPIMIKIAPIMKKYTKFCKECEYKSLKNPFNGDSSGDKLY